MAHKIEWTEQTWNPSAGCTKISAGCKHCYAETMAFVTLSASELLRAFTARSERYPLLKIGLFSNKWMNLAVLSSFVLMLGVVYIPFLNPVFQTTPIGWSEWSMILPLLIVPSVVAELTKWLIYRKDRKKAE